MTLKIFSFFILIALITMSCGKEKADFIIIDAKIYTVNQTFDIAQSFAVKDGKIIGVGSTKDIEAKFESDSIISMSGRFIYPGFIDAHSHFYGYGAMVFREVDLTETQSYEEVIERIKEFAAKNKTQWIEGRGWDQNDWQNKEFPTKEKLDEAFPEIPVYLTRIDGHAALVNSKALQIAGIDESTKMAGGEVLLKNGKPNGILIDNAMSLVVSKIPKFNHQENIKALLLAQENCFKVGLTGVCDAGLDKDMILLIDSMHKAGTLKMPIYAMLNPTDENFDYFVKKGIYKTDYLTVSSIKLYADGALGSRGAKLLKPYTDKENYSGILVAQPEYFDKMAEFAYKYNYQLNTHCIGDSAVRLILKTYAKYLKGKNDRRWRIEHAQIVDKEDFVFFGDFSIIPSIQTTHATSDMYWAEKRLGNERIKNAYAYKQLLEQNAWLPNGSDFPIEKIEPLLGFYAAVSRKDVNLFPEGGFQSENALSRVQAMKAMTIWAAKAAFEENEKGSLEVGKFANFVVCDRDLMEMPENEIFKTEILQTFVHGEKVFAK